VLLAFRELRRAPGVVVCQDIEVMKPNEFVQTVY
jgi:hypothetical protein